MNLLRFLGTDIHRGTTPAATCMGAVRRSRKVKKNLTIMSED